MSEEIKEPAVVVPRAMIYTILINGAMGFAMVIALLFSMGDIDTVLTSPVSLAGYPFIQIYYNAVESLSGTNAMTMVSLVIIIFANWGLMAGCSRTTWAFARDRGLPGSRFLAEVGKTSQVPFRAIMLSVVIQMLLGLINIASATAFNAFVNSAAVTLYISYVSAPYGVINALLLTLQSLQITPVVLGVLKRHRGEHIPYGPFQLGRWRNIINYTAIVYTFFTSFFLFWPSYIDPTAETMNWSIALVGGMLVFAVFWWFVHGRKTFVGPDINATLGLTTVLP